MRHTFSCLCTDKHYSFSEAWNAFPWEPHHRERTNVFQVSSHHFFASQSPSGWPLFTLYHHALIKQALPHNWVLAYGVQHEDEQHSICVCGLSMTYFRCLPPLHQTSVWWFKTVSRFSPRSHTLWRPSKHFPHQPSKSLVLDLLFQP